VVVAGIPEVRTSMCSGPSFCRAPVDMSGVWNVVKGGSTVPLKFESSLRVRQIDRHHLGQDLHSENRHLPKCIRDYGQGQREGAGRF
jgi:hypothetical protein